MSEGKNIMILKVVGYAEAITKYYKIDDLRAHVWIAHQRFPTKGRVWHPGGAHPFGGINTALVHNGDFANYHSVCEYLAQRHIYPQFLTDTEVSVLLFDLLRPDLPLSAGIYYRGPGADFGAGLRPPSRGKTGDLPGHPGDAYPRLAGRPLVLHHRPHHCPRTEAFQLMGITDTAMLRPQVFAFCDGEVQVGLIASEKQAIDATLLSLSCGRQPHLPGRRPLLERPGRQPYGRRRFIFNLKPDDAGQTAHDLHR